MFVGRVDLGNRTGVNLVIVPLKGTSLPGRWDTDTDLLLMCVLQNNRCCLCEPDEYQEDHYEESLGLVKGDAKRLTEWMVKNLGKKE